MNKDKLLRLDRLEISKMNEKELRKAIHTLEKYANPRIERLYDNRNKVYSDALQARIIKRTNNKDVAPYYEMSRKQVNDAAKFSTKGKTRNQLVSEMSDLVDFMTSKTGSVNLAKKSAKKFEVTTGIKGYNKLNVENKKRFWDLYNKLEDLAQVNSGLASIFYSGSSSERIKAVFKYVDNTSLYDKGKDVESVIDDMMNNIEDFISKVENDMKQDEELLKEIDEIPFW